MPTAAYNHLVEWRQDPHNMVCMSGGNDGVSFATQSELVADTDEQDDDSSTKLREDNRSE